MAPMNAKPKEHLKQLELVDPRDQFKSTITKWKNVSTFAIASGFSHHVRNGPTCKDKWIIIYNDYCKVKDYMYTTSVNAYYWALLVQDRIALDLPPQYVRDEYQIIKAFSSSWPIF